MESQENKKSGWEGCPMCISDKLPSIFQEAVKSQMLPFLQAHDMQLLRETAVRLFNDALWKLKQGDWVLEEAAIRTFVLKQVNAISIKENSSSQNRGILHLVGDPLDETFHMENYTSDTLPGQEMDDTTDSNFYPVLETPEKTMALLEALHPEQPFLFVNKT